MRSCGRSWSASGRSRLVPRRGGRAHRLEFGATPDGDRQELGWFVELESVPPAAGTITPRPVSISTGPVGDELPVAVLFADIRGFTAFSEALLPYDTVDLAARVEQANKDLGARFLTTAQTTAELRDSIIIGRTFHRTLPGVAGEHTLVEALDTA